MNIYDAIENVELCVRYAMSDCNTTPEEDAEDEEALTIAIEAMRKQEPMRPEADGEFGSCKRCWYVFNSELISEHCVKYCPYCGQAIDWREE